MDDDTYYKRQERKKAYSKIERLREKIRLTMAGLPGGFVKDASKTKIAKQKLRMAQYDT